ncbi:phosphoglycerate mutase-like protein [Cucurbitaria berberidis CBS 394.84]|uniref:Phosphoglycerate mutase-like protein n=1 Tax=Cucurbitaria berberidis CBS 394.84 TaxID=1168544 RepID=A0A9P4GUC8_9PLEO|nr:phosphoglycerate mutase-like protein [Cucurbitaria berberidis CBS 394.84]KAF1851987.1 phosphoglycerate mutase-like protein [Cucurbitaria berberidis CBS 394.84]
MARSMRLFLVRHGETVDNVAQLYAGSRDSELTNHGYQQATRLGTHFRGVGLSFTHIFSSHLQRAAKTAGKIREAQLTRTNAEGLQQAVPDVIQLSLLMEQDFGSMEGKKWYDRSPEVQLSGKEHHRQENKDTAGFVDVESKDAMAQRADTFLDEHLLLLLEDSAEATDLVVAIVSHGIFLSSLWKRILLRLPPKSVVLCPELQATARPSLEHLGGWSNTGYLELCMTKTLLPDSTPAYLPSSPAETPATAEHVGKVELLPAATGDVATDQQLAVEAPPLPAGLGIMSPTPRIAKGWTAKILNINGKDHLKGLKRTGGGVGSSRHDASQKSIETFFKRRKVE